MKFRDVEDKLDMLEATFSLLGHKVVLNSYSCGAKGEWLDSFSICIYEEAYQITFISNADTEIEVIYVREFKRHSNHINRDFSWKNVKLINYPTEDQVNEVIDFFIAEVGADKNGV